MRSRQVGPRLDPASFSEADVELAETLDSLDGASNYADWIFELLEPHLGDRILEVGAGHGTFTELLARKRTVVATELSPRCISELQARFEGRPDVTVLATDVAGAAPHGPYHAAVLVNVLEHIEDDDAALKDLTSMLRPEGRLILWVPAFEGLYSEFDRRVGHYRRYRAQELRAKLSSAGLEPVELRYANSVGAVAWWIFARQLRRNPTSPGSARMFDRLAVPLVRRLERWVKLPFGQSVFAVGVRPVRVTPEFVLATANSDKAREIADILGPSVNLLPRPACVPDVEETGDTLLANALIKARALVSATGQAAIADDTGLEVDALDGAPGVYSARYAGEHATYGDNVAKLVGVLEGKEDGRGARFKTVAVAAWPDGRTMVAEGVVEGEIAVAPRGRGGFGYDPVFVPREGNGRTFAEMPAEEKHRLSHRGRAFRALAAQLDHPT